jgi:hypothetical protein
MQSLRRRPAMHSHQFAPARRYPTNFNSKDFPEEPRRLSAALSDLSKNALIELHQDGLVIFASITDLLNSLAQPPIAASHGNRQGALMS